MNRCRVLELRLFYLQLSLTYHEIDKQGKMWRIQRIVSFQLKQPLRSDKETIFRIFPYIAKLMKLSRLKSKNAHSVTNLGY